MVTDQMGELMLFGPDPTVTVRCPREWYREDGSFNPAALKSGDRYVLIELSRGKFTLKSDADGSMHRA